MAKGRDTSRLYSGMDSSAAERTRSRRQEASQEKSEQRNTLSPTMEIIDRLFQQEIELLQRVDLMNIESMLDQEHLAAELMARKKTLEHLKRINTRLRNIMREPKLINKQPEVGFGLSESEE